MVNTVHRYFGEAFLQSFESVVQSTDQISVRLFKILPTSLQEITVSDWN